MASATHGADGTIWIEVGRLVPKTPISCDRHEGAFGTTRPTPEMRSEVARGYDPRRQVVDLPHDRALETTRPTPEARREVRSGRLHWRSSWHTVAGDFPATAATVFTFRFP